MTPVPEDRGAAVGPVPAVRSPWWWIPSLYYGQGLPYVVVMTLAVVLYKNLGLDNTAIALYTSWLYLPWVIKPLWSPLVDLLRTKRWWIVTLQLVIGAALGSVALTLPLAGVFHAAGVVDDGIVLQQSWERMARVLEPKLQGAWNLASWLAA